MKSESIELVTQYKDGKEIKTYSKKIYANKKSLTRSEFYAAYGVGLRPSMIFEIYPNEYKLADVTSGSKTYHATHIKYKGELLEIVRTYEIDRFNMNIIVK